MQEASSMYSQMKANPNHQFPEQEQLKCPRCDSTNTKFCYYNNYNLSQPRHFCKTCRRYWTKGGALRNIPVGGGSRKNAAKRSTTKRQAPPPTNPGGGGGNENHESSQIGGNSLAGQFGNFLAGSGGGQFGNFLYSPTLHDGFSDSDPGRSVERNPDAFLNIGGGNGEWSGSSNGWPDLAMYTPGPTFQ